MLLRTLLVFRMPKLVPQSQIDFGNRVPFPWDYVRLNDTFFSRIPRNKQVKLSGIVYKSKDGDLCSIQLLFTNGMKGPIYETVAALEKEVES